MNIDAETVALLSLILRDAPHSHVLILCVLARSNQTPTPIKFHSNTEYPTFYGYSNERMPYHLMSSGLISNVPRQGFIKNIISAEHLAYAEAIINKAGNWDLSKKLELVSKFIKLKNQTIYKDAGVYLVFRGKAEDYIKDYVTKNSDTLSPFLQSKLGRYDFGKKLLSDMKEPSKVGDSYLKKRYDAVLAEIKEGKKDEINTNVQQQPESKKTFSLKNMVLTVDQTEIRFRQDAKTLALLKILVKKTKGIYFSEEADKLEGATSDEVDLRNTYYEVCRGIGNRLAKVGITDFLQYDFNQAKINPRYKKSSK